MIQLGWRRLYDALGVTTEISGPLSAKVVLENNKTLAIYLGPNPPIGIMSIEGSQYLVPGRNVNLFKTDDKYESTCFLEISLTWARELEPAQLDLLNAGDTAVRDEVLKEASADSNVFEKLLDTMSGILGLRFHRQLVLKPLVEHAFVVGGAHPVSTFLGPIAEVLEGLSLNANSGPNLSNLLQALEKTPLATLEKAGSVFHWLLKAWRERDPISKFLYLFIPLEAVLQSASEADAHTVACFESLTSLVKE